MVTYIFGAIAACLVFAVIPIIFGHVLAFMFFGFEKKPHDPLDDIDWQDRN